MATSRKLCSHGDTSQWECAVHVPPQPRMPMSQGDIYSIERRRGAKSAGITSVNLPELEGGPSPDGQEPRAARGRQWLVALPEEWTRGLDRVQRLAATPRERAQLYLAAMIVVSIPVSVVLAWTAFIWGGKSTNDVKDFTLAVMGVVTGLTGAILGYYYGKEAERGRSAARGRKEQSDR
jgi:hypothetical protein